MNNYDKWLIANETAIAINSMKNNKAVGFDDSLTELIQLMNNLNHEVLHKVKSINCGIQDIF